MPTQKQGKQADKSENQMRKHLFRRRLFTFIALLTILLIIVGILSVLNIISGVLAVVLSLIFTTAGVAFSIYTHLFPSASPPGDSSSQVILLDSGVLPFINYNFIYENHEVIEEIYMKLIQSDITAFVLTGNPGVGKSTLAALVYSYAEKQRLEGNGPFTATALWLRVDASLTMSNLVDRLLGSLGKFIPNFDDLPPQNQALALINAMETRSEPRLVFVDQFENFFKWGGASGFTNRPGVDELLDALNRQVFENDHSRLVLTCSSMPLEIDEHPLIHVQEYHVNGLNSAESLVFLGKQGVKIRAEETEWEGPEEKEDYDETETIQVKPTEAELERLIAHYHGNALALTLLASILPHNSSLTLEDFVHNPKYAQVLTSHNANQLLEYIYRQQLSPVQRTLLIAFSVYRQSVPLEAARAIIGQDTEITEATLNIMLNQHLLLAVGAGRYQLHPVIANFARSHFDTSSEQANYRARQAAHAKAAQYYLQLATTEYPPGEQPWSGSELHLLVEATWQYCRAGQFLEAYELMEQKDIFGRLSRCGGNAILLELYQLLLPLNKWHPQRLQAAHIYNNLGEVYYALEKKQEAHKYFEMALPLFVEEQNQLGKASVLNNLGLIYSLQGREMQFWGYLEQSWESFVLSEQLSEQSKQDGKYRQQSMEVRKYLELALVGYFEQALSIRREEGDREGTGKTLHNMGLVYSALGEKELALEHYEEALGISREIGDRMEEDRILHNLGRVCNTLGKKEKARTLEYLEQTLRIQEEVGDRIEEGGTWNSLGRVYDDMGEKQEAWRCYQKALRIEREVGDRRGVAITLHNIGALYLDLGAYENMLAFFLLAKAILEEIQSPYRTRAERRIDLLREKIGKQPFDALIAKVQPEAPHIVEKALQDGLPQGDAMERSAYFSFSLSTSHKLSQAETYPQDKTSDFHQRANDEEVNDEQQYEAQTQNGTAGTASEHE